ncbi:MAG: hypothetical protein IJ637_09335 [Prevotella sp.]|nr:hypothetical protein [Prevotella sp.]
MTRRLVLILLLLIPVVLMAQDEEMVQVRGNVKFVNDQKEEIRAPDGLVFGVLNRKAANEVELKLRAIIKKYQEREEKEKGNDAISAEREMELSALCTENLIDKRSNKGNFKTNAMPSNVIIMVALQDGEYIRIDLKPGQTEYKNIEKMLKQLKEVDVLGNAQDVPINVTKAANPGDGTQVFEVHIEIPPGTARSDSRLIIQSYAVDCQTDDTVAYTSSMVFDGEEYHEKQVKRMSFDYRNDKLKSFYRKNAILKEKQRFRLDTVIVWKKADPKAYYRGPFTYTFEDFHHVYYIDGKPGTCLEYSPFKLLSFEAAASEIPLTREFYERAESKMEKRNRKLNLRFEMGTATLINDSLNQATQEQLIKELRSYGNKLQQVTIMGAASPDGSMKRNEELANQRVAIAQRMVSGKIPVTPKKEVKVYTWTDVAQELREHEKEDEAQAVEEVIEGGGDDQSLTAKMKALPFYNMDVIPILEAQRTMRCSYMFQDNYVMTPDECVIEYYKNKQKYINFEKHFSNGDYYNLFDNIIDSLELDTITMMAHHEILGEPDYEIENVMAPYVFNRYAVMQLKRGTPDVEILRPFIDLKRHGKEGKGGIDVQRYSQMRAKNVPWNRHEIVANQAAAYYMLERGDTAQFLVEWLKNTGHADKGIEQLEHLINLRMLHFRQRTAAENRKYEAARTAVLEMSDENKAILYTEVEEWHMRHLAPFWVSKMQDDNPKKWYLKGLLAAFDNEKLGDFVPSYSSSSSKHEKTDTTFYKWSTEKLEAYQIEQYESPQKQKELLEYQQKLSKYRKEHDGQEPPMEPTADAQAAEGKTQEADGPSAKELAAQFKGIPQYLAYFQHCFDLDGKKRKYWRFYGRELDVSEEMRKQHGYKLKERPIYRAMFEQMKQRDDDTPISLPGEEKKTDDSAAANGSEETGQQAEGAADKKKTTKE